MKLIIIALLVGACLTSVEWPRATYTKNPYGVIFVMPGQTFDGFLENKGKWVRYEKGIPTLHECNKSDGRSDDAVFLLFNKATLKNVILGTQSIKNVYCVEEECTIENVWWENVCQDAITIEGSTKSSSKYYIKGGGAINGKMNIIKHNSAGTVYIENFYVENSEQFYRSCENCKNEIPKRGEYQGKRTAFLTNVTAIRTSLLAGYNTNYGDIVTIQNTTNASGGSICKKFEGRNDGKEARALGYTCQSRSITKCVCN